MTNFVVQPDYGGFNSRFLGLQLRFHPSHPRALLKFLSMQTGEADDVLKEGKRALDGPDDVAFHTFALGTVLAHEARHFHDFLLSPVGNSVFRLRVLGILHGIQGLPDLSASGILPVPLTRWVDDVIRESVTA